MRETERVARGLIDRTLPKTEWTHHAHLRAGLWHVMQHGAVVALELLRARISAYNESVGTANTDASGYHETITRFYVRVLCDYVAKEEAKPVGSWPERVSRLLARYGDRELPLRHYTKDLLLSREARFGWVEPDLLPLDPEAVSR